MTVHGIRHACALPFLEGGADIVSIQNLLAHSRIGTTAVYLKLTTPKHLARALELSHSRERLTQGEPSARMGGGEIP